MMEHSMNEVAAQILDSPLKTCAVTFTLASLGYLTIKGVQNMLSKDHAAQPYPPGPPRYPLIGAMASFPKDHFYQRFTEWAQLYGDIVYAPLPGMNMVILNSYDAAQELLSKRPGSTSGRRIGYLVTHLMDFKWNVAFIQPGTNHSTQRKMLRRGVGPQRVASYDPAIESETVRLMEELETFQGNPTVTIEHALGRLVSKFTYGEKILEEMGEDLSHWNAETMQLMNQAFAGFWPVDVFHFLRFIPDWVPGLRFKFVGRLGRDLSQKVRFRAYERGLKLYKNGTLGHCILNDLLEEFGESEYVQDATAVLYSAAADTTTGAIVTFLHVLWLYPEVSRRVYEEIQTVTHGLRLPQVTDRPNLPYTEAVFKESIRIRPFAPLGVPHVNDQDEIIRGYLIPKGTMINQCIGAMLADTKVWGDPDVFRPERFLEPDASQRPNPLVVLFGFGTRMCPGMYLADRIVLHLVATVMSLFDIIPLEGKTLPDLNQVEWSATAMQLPLGFECRFVVRDKKARDLLNTLSFHD
ncbi:cytochrome P450 [Serendipita vermifera]|nr:cytochrome P450 [Serendipita vermifera]